MDKLTLLQSLIDKTTDKAELEKLGKEMREAIRDEERAKIEKDLAEKAEAKKLADEKAAALAKSPEAKVVKASGIEVGAPGLYKGRKLKMEIEALGGLRKEWKEDKESAEIVAKAWIDAFDRAQRSPAPIAKATVMGEDNTAAYLVAPEYPNLYWEYAQEYSRALQICDNIPMTTHIMYVPAELAKCSIAQTAEGVDATATSATFSQVTLTAKRFDAYTTVSNEVLTDLNTPVLPILMRQLTEATGQKVDSAVFNGTGDPMSSVFSSAAGYSVVLGSGSSTFASVGFSSFLQVVGTLPSARQVNARWVANRSPLWTYIYKIKDDASRPVFLNNIDSGAIKGAAGTILGFPVTQLETGPSTTAVSTAITVLGDFSGVKIGHRLDTVDLFLDPYTSGKSYQTNVYMFTRWAFSLALANNFVRLVTAGS
jgi:HK97 family phage major capsid protein